MTDSICPFEMGCKASLETRTLLCDAQQKLRRMYRCYMIKYCKSIRSWIFNIFNREFWRIESIKDTSSVIVVYFHWYCLKMKTTYHFGRFWGVFLWFLFWNKYLFILLSWLQEPFSWFPETFVLWKSCVNTHKTHLHFCATVDPRALLQNKCLNTTNIQL